VTQHFSRRFAFSFALLGRGTLKATNSHRSEPQVSIVTCDLRRLVSRADEDEVRKCEGPSVRRMSSWVTPATDDNIMTRDKPAGTNNAYSWRDEDSARPCRRVGSRESAKQQ